MVKLQLHDLLKELASELRKGPDEDKGKLEILTEKCLGRANTVADITKNPRLKNDYRTALKQLNRHNDASYKDIDKWSRVVLNTLMVTFPHRF